MMARAIRITRVYDLASAEGDLVLVDRVWPRGVSKEKLAGVTGTGVPLCVDADGSAINPDGSRCEPGTIGHGESASFVITTKVTGKPRHVATARLCLQSEATGVVGPCLVVPVGIA